MPSNHPTPAEQMLKALRRAREDGEDFDQGWYRAMRSRHSGAVKWSHDTTARRDWKAALESSRDEWRAAYYNRPTAVSAVLGAMSEHLSIFDDFDAEAPYEVAA